MKASFFIILGSVFLSGCMMVGREPSFVGTWKMADEVYFLRIYPDSQAAIWPSPLDGETGWTTFRGGKLAFGDRPPLHDPTLSFRGSALVMHTNVADRVFRRVPDITPP